VVIVGVGRGNFDALNDKLRESGISFCKFRDYPPSSKSQMSSILLSKIPDQVCAFMEATGMNRERLNTLEAQQSRGSIFVEGSDDDMEEQLFGNF